MVRLAPVTTRQRHGPPTGAHRTRGDAEVTRPTGDALPRPLATLVGRAAELAGVTEQLRRARLVTLTGPGGVGKTRLAVEVARRSRQGAMRQWIVDLTAVTPSGDVAAEAARAMGVAGSSGATASTAVRHLVGDDDALLVLDNCEHVIDDSAELVAGLLAGCRRLRVLATSREALAVDGETVWPVEPLEIGDARRLFVDRATQRLSGYIPTESDEDAIGRLCVRLDGLPLAIELAAARINAMSPVEIAASLDTPGVELGGPRRPSPARHRTVRAAVDWSYRLLEDAERAAVRRLAVFVGSFDAAAAIEVMGASLDVLTRLVDKSLVSVVERSRAGVTRYRLLETVRQHLEDHLEEQGEADSARARLLHHFVEANDTVPDGWPSPRAEHIVNTLAEDLGNVRAALDWAVDADPCAGVRLLASTRDLFFMLGNSDGARLAEVLLARCPDVDRHRVVVQLSEGLYAQLRSDPATASAAFVEGRRLAVEVGDRGLEGWALFLEGLTHVVAGHTEPGRPPLEAGREILEELGDRIGQARATSVLGLAAAQDGEVATGRDLVESALAICVAGHDVWGQGHCHTYLGILGEMAGADPARITFHFRTAVDRLRPLRDTVLLPVALAGQAGVLVRRDPARALTVIAAAQAMKTRVGGDFPPYFRSRVERVRSTAQDGVGADATHLWKQGERLTVDDAIALAFGTTRHRPERVAGLSAREQDVARLVADGRANKEIATQLHLSVRTVETHVRNILAKLALTNRTQLATWARDRIQ